MRKKFKQPPYNVKVYYCDICGHQFHTINPPGETCNKCNRGKLKVIDKYKSKRIPRASGKRGKWIQPR